MKETEHAEEQKNAAARDESMQEGLRRHSETVKDDITEQSSEFGEGAKKGQGG